MTRLAGTSRHDFENPNRHEGDRASGPAVALLGILARLPLPLRRCALRAAFVLARGILDMDAGIAPRISQLLHMPMADARRVAAENTYHLFLFALESMALGRRSRRGLLKDARSFTCAQPRTLKWASEQRSVILAGLHIGPYPFALAWMLQRHFRDREIIIVRSKQPDPEEARAFARLEAFGIKARILFVDRQESFLQLLRSVRAGGVLAMLVDLPASYGRSAETEILWRPARMAIGVSDISALCSAPIILFRVRSRVTGDRIEVDRVSEAIACDEGTRRRIAGRIGRFLSDTLLSAPEQWLYWRRVDEFLTVPST